MANKKSEIRNKKDQAADQQTYVDSSVVYDLRSLWEMKFIDPVTGKKVMVRKAFKPRGKLEFYSPEY